eukprot:363360-Chlamydomonas_euryale.AAC.7
MTHVEPRRRTRTSKHADTRPQPRWSGRYGHCAGLVQVWPLRWVGASAAIALGRCRYGHRAGLAVCWRRACRPRCRLGSALLRHVCHPRSLELQDGRPWSGGSSGGGTAMPIALLCVPRWLHVPRHRAARARSSSIDVSVGAVGVGCAPWRHTRTQARSRSLQLWEDHLRAAHRARVLALHPRKDARHVEVVPALGPDLGVVDRVVLQARGAEVVVLVLLHNHRAASRLARSLAAGLGTHRRRSRHRSAILAAAALACPARRALEVVVAHRRSAATTQLLRQRVGVRQAACAPVAAAAAAAATAVATPTQLPSGQHLAARGTPVACAPRTPRARAPEVQLHAAVFTTATATAVAAAAKVRARRVWRRARAGASAVSVGAAGRLQHVPAGGEVTGRSRRTCRRAGVWEAVAFSRFVVPTPLTSGSNI